MSDVHIRTAAPYDYMSRVLRITLVVLTGLGLLVLASSYFVSQTLNEWFERDLAGRADLALAGARDKLVEDWSGTSTTRMTALLTALTHDERLVAAAACSRTGALLAATTEWPAEVSCNTIARHVRPAAGAPASDWTTWRSGVEMEGGPAHLSALPLIDRGTPLGFVLLLHDFGFAERREARIQQLLVGTFAVLAGTASLLTIIIRRASWHGWTIEIQRMLRGDVAPSRIPAPDERRPRADRSDQRRTRHRRHRRLVDAADG